MIMKSKIDISEKLEDFDIKKRYNSLFNIGRYVKSTVENAPKIIKVVKPKKEIINIRERPLNLELRKKELKIKLNFFIKGYKCKMMYKKQFDEVVFNIKKEIKDVNKEIKNINIINELMSKLEAFDVEYQYDNYYVESYNINNISKDKIDIIMEFCKKNKIISDVSNYKTIFYKRTWK